MNESVTNPHSSFNQAYDVVMLHEGFYSNDPDDPGGETYKGIARNRWPDWEGWEIIDKIKQRTGIISLNHELASNLDLQFAIRKFYKAHFWNVIWGDFLAEKSIALAIDMFDMSVNLGSGRATMFMQRACNALNNRQKLYADILVDGDFGPNTAKAVSACVKSRNIQLLYKVINILQGAYYVSLMEQSERFEKYSGWFNRVDFLG